MLEYSLDILFVLRYAIESPLDFLHVYQNIGNFYKFKKINDNKFFT